MRTYPGLDLSWSTPPTDDDVDRMLAEVDDFGPTAVETRDEGVRLFFATGDSRRLAAVHLIAVLPEIECVPVDVADDQWAERSQAALTAIRVGGLTIAPPWDVPAGRPDVIIIHPSMGFGTGHHASTRLCLRLLQAAPVAGSRVIDVGTGSGVLALAAWRLGAAEVVAVDYDTDALANARENVALNDAAGAVELRQLDIERSAGVVHAPFSLVLANLTGGLLVRLAVSLVALAGPAGLIIVSGVTLDEEAAVTGAFVNLGCQARAREVEDEWVGLALTTPTRPTAR